MRGGSDDLVVVLSALLHLNETPSSRLRVANVVWHTGDTNSVRHKLDLIFHTSCELAALGVTVDVNLLRSAGDDENGDFAGFEHARARERETERESPNDSDAAHHHPSTNRMKSLLAGKNACNLPKPNEQLNPNLNLYTKHSSTH